MMPNIEELTYRETGNFFLIAGPCVIENEKITFETAEKIKELSIK